MTGYVLHAGTPAGEEAERYSRAVANRRGDVLFVWQAGPMAVKGTVRQETLLTRR